ncbi:LysR family transcriptional regulator [Herbihabitans rhizosphaerae]|uniref:LysR family transcriptional regulator n=1 Tax=Herbihabitans rhizosphaerae TaxID=1872711 RepID=A0A4Q7L2H7_9PSEU|nr:LysR family transcriptional regulator ArgP [Herbihabitans rhizosphaerae]RZS43344.1 LysR family transcriptional regulator [Herbihabitans rhizosphaerae]
MMIDLPPESVRTLVAVVDEGTLDAAARALHVTPSAVSQRIKLLEQRAGRVLLVRAKPVRLTESGEVVVAFGRQLVMLERDLRASLALSDDPVPVPIAVNADSLATWFRRVIRDLAGDDLVALRVRREDQDHTTELLRQGLVVAAVTSSATPVQGCLVRGLGGIRYHAAATKAFHTRWLAGRPLATALAEAPVVVFDERDDLQDRFCREVTGQAPLGVRHHVPDGQAYTEAVSAGLGWGVLMDEQFAMAGPLVRLAGNHSFRVPLYWQQWKLDSPSLRRVADAVSAAAAGLDDHQPDARRRAANSSASAGS